MMIKKKRPAVPSQQTADGFNPWPVWVCLGGWLEAIKRIAPAV